MSTYEVNKFCHRLTIEPAHRAAARDDLTAALARFDLTDAERAAISGGDVGQLLKSGVHPLLLVRLCTYGIAELTEAIYAERIKSAFGAANE